MVEKEGVDDVAREFEDMPQAAQAVTRLELKGLVRKGPGGYGLTRLGRRMLEAAARSTAQVGDETFAEPP